MTTFTKLRTGSWGIKSTTPVAKGDRVEVQKKSGERQTVTVERIVWSGNGVWLCAIRAEPKSGGRRGSHGGSYECEECGEYVTPGSRCWETGMVH
jgi:hypothetical protein